MVFYRFPIAIKKPFGRHPKQIDSMLEEAKNMFQLGRYHDHIVNLQGITYDLNKSDRYLSKVR
jgi:hypothetical protein